ncbi:cytochrome P450 [Nocardia sp. NPDC005978]|uniref:cytochrome P450 family protein n=1 Tax=Nocardia sp. NPDC005978 TaxID=3156725 RepID=UPI0033B72BE3
MSETLPGVIGESPQTIAFTPDFIAEPWPVYDRLRGQGPLHRIVLPSGLPAWLVLDYDLSRQVLTDSRFSKDVTARGEIIARLGAGHVNGASAVPSMLQLDPPDHTRLRKLVSKAFTAGASARMRPGIQAIADDLVAELADRDVVDLVEHYALPLPLSVISEMLGFPVEDREQLGAWSRQLMEYFTPDRSEAVSRAATECCDYIRGLIAAKRSKPGPGDLLDELIAVSADGDRLTEDELVHTVFILMIGGHETTVNLIATAAEMLIRNDELRERVVGHPERTPQLIEEALRFDGPAHTATMRHTTEPVVLNGMEIGAGEFVIVGLAAASRDPAKFPDPDRFDPDRSGSAHLAFGHGIHYCVGAALARLEGDIAINTLFQRFPDMRLAPGEDPPWRFSFMRGRCALPVVLHENEIQGKRR